MNTMWWVQFLHGVRVQPMWTRLELTKGRFFMKKTTQKTVTEYFDKKQNLTKTVVDCKTLVDGHVTSFEKVVSDPDVGITHRRWGTL